jgi:hypothetical protein
MITEKARVDKKNPSLLAYGPFDFRGNRPNKSHNPMVKSLHGIRGIPVGRNKSFGWSFTLKLRYFAVFSNVYSPFSLERRHEAVLDPENIPHF